ncbi:MAG: NAD(P)H-dependent oxidoreductase [Pseudomonadota bacterium]
MKTLIVKYLPTGAESKTKMLLDLFLQEIAGKNIETLDLLKEEIPTFNEKSVQAYYKRNYNGHKLDEKEAQLLARNDELAAQLKKADILVMAFPMHNFSIPALAKAWMDAVILKGDTFEPGKKIMKGKKALTIFTSGGVYPDDKFNFDYPNWNSIALITKANFTFMGFDESEIIGTSLRDEKTREENLGKMQKEIQELVKKWYE